MLKATSQISSQTNFLDGQVLLFHKPINWSSFDLVKKIRNTIKSAKDIKKIKVGHAGTLDPLADGLLIICTGKFTKKIETIQGQTKLYTGEITLGSTTPSYDKETEINQIFETNHISKEMIHNVSQQFEGKIQQKPPIYSALKREGKRLYQHAREGTKVIIHAREIEINSFKITDIEMPKITFEVICSKGTYIRSLAFDFGKALCSGAHLTSLRREQIGEYRLSDAFTFKSFKENILK
ncbi:tRNA pseudouridine(55) synthase TruB [bacterium]|nr:tRNA pseudouridine(55) synthase TruB [bacterium]